jgi:hypothetical protein
MLISASLMAFALGYGIYYSLCPERYVPSPGEVTWRTVFLNVPERTWESASASDSSSSAKLAPEFLTDLRS